MKKLIKEKRCDSCAFWNGTDYHVSADCHALDLRTPYDYHCNRWKLSLDCAMEIDGKIFRGGDASEG